jgi:N-acetylneuraminic acid mutarotase
MHARHAFALLFCVAVALLHALSACAAPEDGRWRVRAPVPIPTAFAAVAYGRDGRVYVFGGQAMSDDHRMLAAPQIFDPETNAWSEGAPIPAAVSEPGAAVGAGGRIYVIGGNLPGPGRHASAANYEYDPATNSWRARAPMPSPRAALAVVAAKDSHGRTLLYALGGRDFIDPHNGLSTVEAYDPATDTWSRVASMPTWRHAVASALGPDGNVYAIGGAYRDTRDQPHFADAVEVYDPRTDHWGRAAPTPQALECTQVTSTPGIHGRVFVMGGWYTTAKIDADTLLAYDPATRHWQPLPPAPFPQATGGAVTLLRAGRPIGLLFVAGTPRGTACQEYDFADR